MSEMHKLTSYSDGFGIFNKVAEHEFDVDNKNYLRLFMLNTENKLFNYDELYEYLLPNIARYVFDRKRLAEAEKNPVKQSLILIEAIEHLRKITSDKDRGAGGELGEVLLYLFLEQVFIPSGYARNCALYICFAIFIYFDIYCEQFGI